MAGRYISDVMQFRQSHLATLVLPLCFACSNDPGSDDTDHPTGSGGMDGATGGGGTGDVSGAGGTGDVVGAGGSGNAPGAGGAGVVPGTGGGSSSDADLTASEAAAAMGRGFNLGQMFENTQHPRTLEAASAKIDAYYDRGFRNVRIPVTWTEEVGGDVLVTDPTVGTVNRDHPRLKVIESVVDYALSKPDLFVVINAHHEHALKTEARATVLQNLWADIADIFQARDHRLLFEILNEPHKDDSTAMAAADVRSMTGLAYDEIRAVDAKRIVIIGGNQWFGAQEVPQVWTDLEPVGGGSDPYVMATFHHYNPWTFCGSEQGDYSDAWMESDISGPMQTMKTWAEGVGQGMPVYIGEWGVGWGSRYSTMSCNNIRLWYTQFVSEFATASDQPTAVWDDGGWFAIFNHGTGNFSNNLIDCIEGSCTWDGEERMNEGCN